MRRQNLPPDFMPVLSRGHHRRPAKGACFMEFASFLAAERWSDHPQCTHPLLATLARNVNDQMSDDGRQQLLGMVPSVVGLTSSDPMVDVRLALLCATTALPIAPAESQRVLAVGILSAERRLAQLEGRRDGALTEASMVALDSVPRTADWARTFSAGIEPTATGFHHSAAPSIVCRAVLGIASACVGDRDAVLLGLLRDGIDLVRDVTVPQAPAQVAARTQTTSMAPAGAPAS
ncbi:hypothetical protein [Cellulomonas fimi]|uniref:Uncharacterized protein n=1 Tax=Cellulomonas fimi TaxID=1708 RepID=A0A7Y0M1T2_CELFI|nr:hypothetical protein [Cellulomonas fimi]NMR21493.1 hypothetical protein [Cellulomonas fimi]